MLPIPTSLISTAAGRASQLAMDLLEVGLNRLEMNDVPAAMAQFRRAAQICPEESGPQVALAHGALRFGALSECLAYAQAVLAQDTRHGAAHLLSSRAHFGLGDAEAAKEHLEVALSIDPHDAEALYLMAHHGIHGDVSELEELLAGADVDQAERHVLGLALANAHRMGGDLNAASSAAAKAHEELGDAHSGAKQLCQQSELLRVLTSLPWGQGGGCREGQPTFVVGLPQSGAMLAERAIVHSAGHMPAGPVRALMYLVNKLPRCSGAPYPRAAAVLDPHTATVLAGRYREHASVGSEVHWVDRCPDGARYLPLALRMFPQAQVVHVTRDLEDAAMDSFLSLFDGDDAPYARDLEAFASQHAFEHRLVDLVESTLPVRVHRVQYEDLVRDPDTVVSDLRLCG